MSTTLYDPAAGWKAYTLGARTDPAGADVDDLTAEDLRLTNVPFTEGVFGANAFQVVEDSPTVGMFVVIGSGSAKSDVAQIDGDIAGQGPYRVRMEDATVDLTVPAADLSNPRIDEVYLVVQDDAYDSSSRVLPRIAYRDGTPGSSPSAPGPDAAWDAYMLIATIDVKAGESEITDAEITDERVYSDLSLGGSERVGVESASDLSTTIHSPTSIVRVRTSDGLALSVGGSAVFLEGRAISNVGDVDGVDVSAHAADADAHHAQDHAARHAQGGADSFEVDNATEVASADPGGTFSNVASVTLSIPAGWNSWKCTAWASYVAEENGNNPVDVETLIRIDGTDQQTKVVDLPALADSGDSVGGRRTGMTTTGSRTVALRAREGAGVGSYVLSDIYLTARAVRTS